MLKENRTYDLTSCEAINGDRALAACPRWEADPGNIVMLDNNQIYNVRSVIVSGMIKSEIEALEFHAVVRECKAIYRLEWEPEKEEEEADQDA